MTGFRPLRFTYKTSIMSARPATQESGRLRGFSARKISRPFTRIATRPFAETAVDTGVPRAAARWPRQRTTRGCTTSRGYGL